MGVDKVDEDVFVEKLAGDVEDDGPCVVVVSRHVAQQVLSRL